MAHASAAALRATGGALAVDAALVRAASVPAGAAVVVVLVQPHAGVPADSAIAGAADSPDAGAILAGADVAAGPAVVVVGQQICALLLALRVVRRAHGAGATPADLAGRTADSTRAAVVGVEVEVGADAFALRDDSDSASTASVGTPAIVGVESTAAISCVDAFAPVSTWTRVTGASVNKASVTRARVNEASVTRASVEPTAAGPAVRRARRAGADLVAVQRH